jgi:hypothetical protein
MKTHKQEIEMAWKKTWTLQREKARKWSSYENQDA